MARERREHPDALRADEKEATRQSSRARTLLERLERATRAVQEIRIA